MSEQYNVLRKIHNSARLTLKTKSTNIGVHLENDKHELTVIYDKEDKDISVWYHEVEMFNSKDYRNVVKYLDGLMENNKGQ